MTEQATNVKKEESRKRIPLGTRNVLTAPKRTGFVRRFVNDKGDRIQRFKDAGYSIVEEDIQVGDEKIGKPNQLGSSVSSQGDGQRKVLMEIPEEFYNEDQKIAQDKITAIEKEINRNSTQSEADGLHGKVQIS
jgi:hypothetical protein